MENTFIIASHSTYAQGLYQCLKFFKDDIVNVHYLNAYVEDNEFEKHFVDLVEGLKAENLIVLTDMPGGSVNQICMKLMERYGYHLISGVNFPLALELIFCYEKMDAELIHEFIDKARQQIIYINEVEAEEADDDL